MNHVCDKKVWDRILIFNFSIFLSRIKKLEDDLEIFLYLKFRFYSFVFSNLSLYSVFSKELVTRKNLVSIIVNSVLEFIHKFLTMNIFLEILLLINKILLLSSTNFLDKVLFFLFMFVILIHSGQTHERVKFLVVHMLKISELQINYSESF